MIDERIEWEAHGYRCVALRGSVCPCGYIAVPTGHPWFGLQDECDADVHGGITWARHRLPGEPEATEGDVWWLGFDTAHAGDGKWTMEMVRDETEIFAEMAAEAGRMGK